MVRWPLQKLQPFQKTQLQPPVGPSVDSFCHPWFTTTNLSYRFPIFETSATALCGTTGILQKWWTRWDKSRISVRQQDRKTKSQFVVACFVSPESWHSFLFITPTHSTWRTQPLEECLELEALTFCQDADRQRNTYSIWMWVIIFNRRDLTWSNHPK